MHREKDDRMKVPKHAVQWNLLAEKHDLPAIGGFRAKARAEQVAYYQTLTEDFWRDLDAALGRRGQWARSRRFPWFDQVLDESIAAKLFEGYYEDDDRSPQAEHDTVLAELLRTHLDVRLPSGGVIVTEGISAARGLERWSEVSVERLRAMIERLSGDP